MKLRPRLFFIIPVLNESENMNRLAESFRSLSFHLNSKFQIQFLMVDDGSTDGTGAIITNACEGLKIQILTHPIRRGPGFAFGTAFEALAPILRDDDWIVTLEGDNTSRPEILLQMLLRIHEGYEVILASPYMYGGGIQQTTALRIFLSHVANLFLKECLGIHGIFTMSSFYRLHQGKIILRLQSIYGPRILERSGFEALAEMLIKMMYLKIKISEVPMVLDTSRRMGKSKMQLLRTIRDYLTLVLDQGRWRMMMRQSIKKA